MKIVMKAMQFSDRPWGDVNKSKLPRSAFLVSTSDKKEDWNYPYKDENGKVVKGALSSICQNLAGARTPKKFSVPSSKMAYFQRMYKAAFGKKCGED